MKDKKSKKEDMRKHGDYDGDRKHYPYKTKVSQPKNRAKLPNILTTESGPHSQYGRGVTAPKFNEERVVTKSPAQYMTKPESPKRPSVFSKQVKPKLTPPAEKLRKYPDGLQFINQIKLQGQDKVSTSFKISEEFNIAKHEAIEIQGWKLWKNKLNKLVVVPADDTDSSRRYYTFDYEPGVMYFIQPTHPNQVPYVYFRGTKFQEFLEKYKINKVVRKDPNGLFAGKQKRSEDRTHWLDEFNVFSVTGYRELSDTTDLSLCTYITSKDIPSNNIKTVKIIDNQHLAIAVQATVDASNKLTLHRTLIISGDMYEHELDISKLTKEIDSYF